MINFIFLLFKIGIGAIYLVAGSSENDPDSKCGCKNDTPPIISFKGKEKGEIIFCGGVERKLAENKIVISEFKVIDCQNGTTLINHSEDTVSKSIVTISRDSLLLSETHYILNSKWEIDIVPAVESTIKFVKGEPFISQERKVFVAPKLAKAQTDSLLRLNKNLKNKIKSDKSVYPYGEKSIYLLFMGAINGNKDAKYLLKNLDSLFILDDASAETRSEIWLDF